ncbi:MAG: ATP-binding cassette domain-containing protein [Chthoniobacterales bacterium]|nr:ATP-binding cassette domain-containing protein [Chthoniobacterales bacterium]
MPLFQLHQVTLSYGSLPLLDHVNLQIERGERICLVGRNGTGKTSLMRLMTREEVPSEGEVITAPGTVVTYLSQEIPDQITGSVMEVLRSGLPLNNPEEEWESDMRLEALAERISLRGDDSFSSLSGGLKRRTLLGRALAGKPNLLLLDEPTNHLDLETILWLEDFLLSTPITLFFVTHDRAFLKKLATRIVELDRGVLTSWNCDYNTYLERKAACLEAEGKQWSSFDKKLAQEEAWLRQGVKARRTRNEGRVRALEKLRQERSERRERSGKARLSLQHTSLSGQKVIEAKEVSFAYEGINIVDHFTTTIWRGDKIGIIGSNGAGKTTLLKLLLGEITPSHGSLHLGTKLEVVYFDQLRGAIDPEKSVAANVAGDADTVIFQGRPRHIHSYLEDFLFHRERIRMPAKVLSGGERNRLLLAKLFLQPANVLVMDEPTNDLDAETMELLEELILEYNGTLLLVSHDRAFLNSVVTSTLVFEGEGKIMEYNGGYDDWVAQRPAPKLAAAPPLSLLEKKSERLKQPSRPIVFPKREERELIELPLLIEKCEAEKELLVAQLCDPEFYKKEPQRLHEIENKITFLEEQIATRYARWEELEEKRKNIALQFEGVE